MKDEEAVTWASEKLKESNVKTDGGCTFSPDFNFKECCLLHDVMRNYSQGILDKQADKIFRECIKSRGHPVIAWIYWGFVRYESTVSGVANAVAIIVFATVTTLLYFFG